MAPAGTVEALAATAVGVSGSVSDGGARSGMLGVLERLRRVSAAEAAAKAEAERKAQEEAERYEMGDVNMDLLSPKDPEEQREAEAYVARLRRRGQRCR